MRVLDLFSGIGGFSLGLERAGMKTVAFCEIDPYCRAVLRKHWPDVPIYDDVRTLTAARLAADGILHVADASGEHDGRGDAETGARQVQQSRIRDGAAIDLICGGFPCQDISVAGKGAGIEGSRSGLWSEYARIIGEVRSRYVIVENVAALLSRGLDRVLGDLAALGYDAEWHCIPACAVGAPHRRDRLWIIAHANEQHVDMGGFRPGVIFGRQRQPADICASDGGGGPTYVADASRHMQPEQEARGTERQRAGEGGQSIAVADAIVAGLEGRPVFGGHLAEELAAVERGGEVLADAMQREQRRPDGAGWRRIQSSESAADCGPANSQRYAWWLSEPDVGRVAHGVPARVDRLRSLGNAVVPQIPEIIGRAIIEAV